MLLGLSHQTMLTENKFTETNHITIFLGKIEQIIELNSVYYMSM